MIKCRVFSALSPLLFCAVSGTCAAQTVPRPDAPDAVRAFLPAPAPTVSGLVREVRRDAAVRRRYADFFHVSEAKVVSYLSARLLPKTLSRPGSYTVYYVSAAGTLYPARQDLSPGTPVFVGSDGVPVLLRGAGNPVTPFSMAVQAPPPPLPVILPPPPVSVQDRDVPAGADIPVPATPPAR